MEIKPVLMDWRISTVKMPILPKAIYGASEISMKISRVYYHFFVEIKKIILKFVLKNKGSQIVQASLRKNEAESITVPDFRLYYKSVVLKIEWYCFKNRQHNGRKLRVKKLAHPYMVH